MGRRERKGESLQKRRSCAPEEVRDCVILYILCLCNRISADCLVTRKIRALVSDGERTCMCVLGSEKAAT